MLRPPPMPHANLLLGMFAGASVGLFLFIANLGEFLSRRRIGFELLLSAPLLLYGLMRHRTAKR